MITENEIAEWNKLRGQGMESAVGEYTPPEFWDALDEIGRLRAGYKRLKNSSDSEMRDGDLARDIADEMLTPNEPAKGRAESASSD